ncbi:hypothetical protein GCM10022247_65860 [Allokutzneria multivorans]|uniref:XRE family transcriptional regulator n=1 Tax=Allokutzneria multivorans TaxID=1142134 RepID=A0ABP7TUY5_9PSEU
MTLAHQIPAHQIRPQQLQAQQLPSQQLLSQQRTIDQELSEVLRTGPFDLALRTALDRRGLPLDRIQDRLAAQGVTVSLSTLSYWQRGRRRPERADSLRAIALLEDILRLPRRSLSSLIGPPRPRGRGVRAQERLSLTDLYGADSDVSKALGTSYEHINAKLDALSLHDEVTVGTDRSLRRVRSCQVQRANADGADRLVVIFRGDADQPLPTSLRSLSGQRCVTRYDRERMVMVNELFFARRLAKGESVLVEYEVEFGEAGTKPSTCYERCLRTNVPQYLLQVRFEGELPAHCHRSTRLGLGARDDRRAVSVDLTRMAYLHALDCQKGFHGINWQW